MNESQLPSSSIPAHPDFFLILQNTREKYNIPEINPEADIIDDFLLTAGIDLEIIRQDPESGSEEVDRSHSLDGTRRRDSKSFLFAPTTSSPAAHA